MNKEHVSLSLDEALLQKIDALAKTEHEDRSGVVTKLLTQALNPAPQGPADRPDVLKSRLESIENWRLECAAEAKKRERTFWWLTLPPLVINGGFGSGLFESLGLGGLQKLALLTSTILLFVEKERPQNRLFTAFQKSASELEQLSRAMAEQWDAGTAAGADPNKLLAQVLAAAEKEEARVSKYIEEAESYLKQASLGKRIKTAAAKEIAALRGSPAEPPLDA